MDKQDKLKKYSDLQAQSDAMDTLVDHAIYSEEKDTYPVFDGIINIRDYVDVPFKILWILKESYDEAGGGGNQRDSIRGYKDLNDLKGNRNTFMPIAHASFGILNNFILCENVHNNDNKALVALQHIGFINVKKYANTKGWKADNKEIKRAYSELKEILWLQIKVYSPLVIIYGNTISHFEDYFKFSNRAFIQKPSCRYCIIDNRIHIEAYHPSYREATEKIKKEDYCNDIILSVKEAVENGSLKLNE